MGKITIEFETKFEKGDVVIFKKNDILMVGLIIGYTVDDGNIWYNIRINRDEVFSYGNGGDVAEWDILIKLDDSFDEFESIITFFIREGENK